jgi:Uma2 family endonuclease
MAIALSQSSPPDLYEVWSATWQDYTSLRDQSDWRKVAFYQGWLWADMGKEGLNHARFSDLLTLIFGFWAFLHPNTILESCGRCLIENAETQAAAPDLVLYRGENIPQWQPGEPRKIDLTRHRVPDLVGEVSDTTLSIDLDAQKQLYASLEIPEYWVIDVIGLRVFAFGLNAVGVYESIEVSQCLTGLSIALVTQTIERLTHETSTAAASWFMQQLQANRDW